MSPEFQNNIPPQNNPISESGWVALKPPRNYAFLITLTILLILTGVFGVWYFSNPAPDEDTDLSVPRVNQFFDSSTSPTASWETYVNTEYGFEFKYPSQFTFDWTDVKIDQITTLQDYPTNPEGGGFDVPFG